MRNLKQIIVLFVLASFTLYACGVKTACGSKSKKGQSHKVNKMMGYKR